jgi:hypothetical protein
MEQSSIRNLFGMFLCYALTQSLGGSHAACFKCLPTEIALEECGANPALLRNLAGTTNTEATTIISMHTITAPVFAPASGIDKEIPPTPLYGRLTSNGMLSLTVSCAGDVVAVEFHDEGKML